MWAPVSRFTSLRKVYIHECHWYICYLAHTGQTAIILTMLLDLNCYTSLNIVHVLNWGMGHVSQFEFCFLYW